MNCYNCGSKRLVCDVERDSYICLDCNYAHQKQYFFISHSHRDLEKVRIIRNVIEETFFYEPILFFFKCLSDEQEINDLIKREIYERIWFVYCKSENAEKSQYVRFEREYIKKLVEGGKQIKILEIDLDKFNVWDEECYEYIRSQIAYKIRKTNIFMSYARFDSELAGVIYQKLKQMGFSVFFDLELFNPNDDWFDTAKRAVLKSSHKDGAVLAIISQRSLESKYFFSEIGLAVQSGAFVIPVIVECNDGESEELLKQFYCATCINEQRALIIKENELEEKTDELCNYLLNY